MLTVLTIGGSDPTGGAGVQADLQVIASLGAHGSGVVAALTVQDTTRVFATSPVPADWVGRQLTHLLADVRVDAVKTGMLAGGPVVCAVAEAMAGCPDMPLVVDPVIRSTSGHELLDAEGIEALCRALLPRATLVMPNLDEAEVLGGCEARTAEQIRSCARAIGDLGPEAVLVKGGHLPGRPSDLLYTRGEVMEFVGERIDLANQVHGTGCALSAAAAVLLARGEDIRGAVEGARAYVAAGLRHAVAIGRGSLVIDYTRAASEVTG
jgi:hydroxymethylpyrimidine kinase/phosphomethylpyrimidine kinase